MTAQQICRELRRVHQEAAVHFQARNPDLESSAPGFPPNPTGQMYHAGAAELGVQEDAARRSGPGC